MAITAGIIGTWIILKIWKTYGIFEAKLHAMKRHMVMGGILVLSILLSYLLGLAEVRFTGYLNVYLFYVLLVSMAGIDYCYKKIPNKLLLVGMISRTILLIVEVVQIPNRTKGIMLTSFLGLIFVFLLLLILSCVSRHAIGFGDVKLFAWIGYCMGGTDTYRILFYGMLAAAVAGLYLMIVKKESSKRTLPLAPFFAMGAYVVMVTKLW